MCPRRPPSYAAPAGFAGGYGTAAFWAMLGALSASDRTAYFRQSQVDPAYQQWRQQAVRDPNDLGAFGGARRPGDRSAARCGPTAPSHQAVRASSGWCCSSRWRHSRCCGWRVAAPRRPAVELPLRASPVSGATRFRVGQTIPLDPAPFLLAAGVTKVQPPPGSGMISVEAVGLLEDAGAQLHRLYLPGRTASSNCTSVPMARRMSAATSPGSTRCSRLTRPSGASGSIPHRG